MPPAPFLVLKLKPGWAFDVDAAVATRHGVRVQLLLPPGARLRAALVLPPSARHRRSAAEREIARYVHLLPPPAMAPALVLALVRDWAFVERAEWQVDAEACRPGVPDG
jgi:hypothetical protein